MTGSDRGGLLCDWERQILWPSDLGQLGRGPDDAQGGRQPLLAARLAVALGHEHGPVAEVPAARLATVRLTGARQLPGAGRRLQRVCGRHAGHKLARPAWQTTQKTIQTRHTIPGRQRPVRHRHTRSETDITLSDTESTVRQRHLPQTTVRERQTTVTQRRTTIDRS